MKETIMAMERYAEANNIPIIELDAIKFIMKYIKLNNVQKVFLASPFSLARYIYNIICNVDLRPLLNKIKE